MNCPSSHSPLATGRPSRRRLAVLTAVLITLVVAVAGCGPEVDTTYGRRVGYGGKSINGTAVLANMFQEAGHKVTSWHVLSPSLQKADVIVWAPDDYDLPGAEVQFWFEEWLRESSDEKVLIYIGRDYDDAVNYWSYVESVAPPDQLSPVKDHLDEARTWVKNRRQGISQSAECPGWMTVDGTLPQQSVSKLTGPWSEGIDASAAAIEHQRRIVPNDDAEVLLATGDQEPLVSELKLAWDEAGGHQYEAAHDWSGSPSGAGDEPVPGRLIIVENGSFLLNRPLINHEHRKIAGQLVAHVGSPRKRVVFLQSTPGGPPVHDTDPTNRPPSGLAMFTVWPISGVLVHVAALGIIFALARWPVFGVPKRLEQTSLTDFGAHITALGKLLQNKGDAPHALALIQNYRQSVLGESAPENEVSKT